MSEMRYVVRERLLWIMPLLVLGLAVRIPHAAEKPTPLARSVSADGVRFGLAPPQRRAFFDEIAEQDANWRAIAEQHFPGNRWAQADHWTDHMSQHVRWMAGTHRISIVPILLAYDEGLHAGWRGPGGQRLRTTWPPLTERKR